MQAEAQAVSTRVASLAPRIMRKISKPAEARPPGPLEHDLPDPGLCRSSALRTFSSLRVP